VLDLLVEDGGGGEVGTRIPGCSVRRKDRRRGGRWEDDSRGEGRAGFPR